MNRVDYLIGRAAALRDLAETIDIQSIRDRVLALSEECVQLAQLVGKPMTYFIDAGRPIEIMPRAQTARYRAKVSLGRAPREGWEEFRDFAESSSCGALRSEWPTTTRVTLGVRECRTVRMDPVRMWCMFGVSATPLTIRETLGASPKHD